MTSQPSQLNCHRHAYRPLTTPSRRQGISLVAIVFAVVTPPSVAFGEFTDFIVDPAQSYITLSGETQAGYGPIAPLVEQFPGSLTTHLFSGSVFAAFSDPSVVQFSNGSPSLSVLNFSSQSTLAQPGGVANQFAATILGFPTGVSTSYAAFQQLAMVIETSSAPNSGGVLTTNQLVFDMTGGWALVAAPGLYDGTLGLSGLDANEATPGSLHPIGAGYRLFIPISIEDDIYGLNLHFTGQFVAYSAGAPEPSTLILAAFGGLALLVLRRR